jgi:peptidoglycan hydrolase-like protein with peptidoglycan-binding domain
VDVRPSELDPYPLAERDLGSAALWQRSLHRSHRRRIRQRDARRNAPRQKGATLAAGAAILATPVLTPLTGAASASSARPGVTKVEVAKKAAVSGEKTWLLSYGDTGEAVAAVQAQLRIPADGIFGPQTEGAVKTFQLNNGLAGTGIVDAKTWVEIFRSKVVFYGDADASASSSSAGSSHSGGAEKVNVVLGSDVPDAVGGPDLGTGSSCATRSRIPSPSPLRRPRPAGPASPSPLRRPRPAGPSRWRPPRWPPATVARPTAASSRRSTGPSPARSARTAATMPTAAPTSRRRPAPRCAPPSAAR